MKRFISMILAMQATAFCATAQKPLMKDIFANAPDSVFPLLTRNNRLDCIDFIENNMAAKVRNKMDDWAELKVLTPTHLLMQTSARGTVEMGLVGDSLICVVRTYKGPAEDSRVEFVTTDWHPVQRKEAARPDVSAFITGKMDGEARGILEALPLMKATLSGDTLTWELQTTELTKEQKKAAEGNLQPVSLVLK